MMGDSWMIPSTALPSIIVGITQESPIFFFSYPNQQCPALPCSRKHHFVYFCRNHPGIANAIPAGQFLLLHHYPQPKKAILWTARNRNKLAVKKCIVLVCAHLCLEQYGHVSQPAPPKQAIACHGPLECFFLQVQDGQARSEYGRNPQPKKEVNKPFLLLQQLQMVN